MANIKSQKKRNITNEKAHQRNKACKSELKTAVRRVREAVAAGNGAEAYAAALAASRLLDKAASKGIIHKNNASNKKSALAKNLNALKAAAAAAPAEEVSAPAAPAEEAPAVEAPAEKPKKTRAKKAKDAE